MNNVYSESKPINATIVKVTEKMKTLNFEELIEKVEDFLLNNGFDKDSCILFDYPTDDYLIIEKTSIVIEEIIELSQVLYDVDDEKLLACINKNAKCFIKLLLNCYFESTNELFKKGCRINLNNRRLEKLIN